MGGTALGDWRPLLQLARPFQPALRFLFPCPILQAASTLTGSLMPAAAQWAAAATRRCVGMRGWVCLNHRL